MKTNKMREEIISIFESAGLQEDETSMQMLDMIMGVFDQALAQKEAEVLGRVGKDTERLDFLDRQNQILNEFHKTEYGWELIINNNVNRLMAGNVNRVDLNDSKAHGVKSCREAIDEKMNQLKTK